MTESDSVFPEHPGLIPRWERRYPGRFRFELEALRDAGVTPIPDPVALQAGQLALTFDWPLDAVTTLRLKAVYPDAFPHMRPQVFLLSELEPRPIRHLSPLEGNLCLLGRDSRQWVPEYTLYRILKEQLEDAVRGTGEEDPQGEPADFWWNTLGPSGACCLVDSTWDLKGTKKGTLRLCYALDGYREEQDASGTNRIPIIRATVSQIYDQNNTPLHEWKGLLPPEVQASNKSIKVPWTWLDQTLFPKPEIVQQVKELYETYPRSTTYQFDRNTSVNFFAFAHPVETAFTQIGVGWVIFIVYGHPSAFKVQGKKRNKQHQLRGRPLPVYRAGLTDLGHRVPAIQLLREKRMLVVGLGAVGAPVAIDLARNGCHTLHLIEYDVVEPGTTVRWPLGVSAWGRPKLEALQSFLGREYPATKVHVHQHHLGQPNLSRTGLGDDDILDAVLSEVDLVIDGTASFGVTALLGERCRQAGVPFISMFASPTLDGGAVVRYSGSGGCPICLEHTWDEDKIPSPPGWGSSEEDLTQPPGCAERTFVGAGYDLQELSLQAVRLAVETLSNPHGDSLVQVLSFIDADARRCPPRWRVDALPRHPACGCHT